MASAALLRPDEVAAAREAIGGASVVARGLIEHRRAHGRSLVFLVLRLVEGAAASGGAGGGATVLAAGAPLQVVLSRRALAPALAASFGELVQPLKPGALVEATGTLEADGAGTRLSLSAGSARLLRCRADPVSVWQLVDAARRGVLGASDAAGALSVSEERLIAAIALCAEAAEAAATAVVAVPPPVRGVPATAAAAAAAAVGLGEADERLLSATEDGGDVEEEEEEEEGEEEGAGEDVAVGSGCSGVAAIGRLPRVLPPRLRLKRELVRLARLLAGLPEERPRRRLAKSIGRRERALLDAAEARVAAAGMLCSVEGDDGELYADVGLGDDGAGHEECVVSDAGDGGGTSHGLDSLLGDVHPRLNVPDPALLPGGGGSSSYEARMRYLELKKAPQVAWMVRELRAMAAVRGSGSAGGDSAAAGGFRHIVDVGGGRADLALALAHSFPDSRVTVVDVNDVSLSAGRARAEHVGLGGRVRFARRDVRELGTGGGAADELDGADIIIGLHACGALTDRILDLAAARRCSFLVVPCCFCRGAASGLGLAGEEACAAAGVREEERREVCALAESNGGGTELRAISVRAMTLVNSARLARAAAAATAAAAARAETAATAAATATLRAFDARFSPRNQALRLLVHRAQ